MGCTMIRVPLTKKNSKDLTKGYRVYDKSDYINHWKAFKEFLLNSEKINLLKIDHRAQAYLKTITSEIVLHNEIFFKEKGIPEFYVISSPVPFHFSLPGEAIYLSSGLINKYIKKPL
jgi:methyl coenzyme M reductase beta subunit